MNEAIGYICDFEQRLDLFLASKINQSRSQIAQLIKKEAVFIDSKLCLRTGVKLKVGQQVKVLFREAVEQPALEVNFDVEVLYEDDDVLVINKPSGLTVHPAPSVKESTLVDWLKHKGIRLSTISGDERHGIVHRLDKGTSGVMVVAKNNHSHEFLSQQLQDKTMGRYYIAVINPPIKDEFSEVECSIARSSNNRLKMACVPNGKYAKTIFKTLLLSNDEKNQLILCKLFTGRTHQIRVHLESLNRHIIGDHLYGTALKNEKSERILLHAYEIYFIHPATKERLTFKASLDVAMNQYIYQKFNKEYLDEFFKTNNTQYGFNSPNERL